MKISVVITSYNYGDYIVQAIDSAIGQTFAPYEIIVVDDGSTDGTIERLNEKRYDGNLVKIVPKANGGQLSAFREGYRRAAGDIVAFLDADDYWDDVYLRRLAELFSKKQSVDFVFANLRYFGKRSGTLNAVTGLDKDLGTTCSVVVLSDNPPWIGSPTSAISMRRDHLGKLLQIPPSYDDDWKIRADDVLVAGSSIIGGHKYYMDDAHVNYRVHGENAWFDRKNDAFHLVKFQIKCERMSRWFKANAFGGQTPGHLVVFYEFKCIEKPNCSQLGAFARFLWRADGPLFGKLKAFAMMANHWRRKLFA